MPALGIGLKGLVKGLWVEIFQEDIGEALTRDFRGSDNLAFQKRKSF